MSLPHAVLTSLLEKPSTGFDLARRFDKSIGYFWRASHQQIYRELARMEAAGWIQGFAPEDAGRTRKRAYRVLDAGREELRRWAHEGVEPMELRDAFTVKLRAAAVLGSDADLLPELRRHVGLHEARLLAYRRIEARDFGGGRPLGRAQAIQRMILLRGVRYEEGEIAWGREMMAVLAAASAPG